MMALVSMMFADDEVSSQGVGKGSVSTGERGRKLQSKDNCVTWYPLHHIAPANHDRNEPNSQETATEDG